MKSNVKPKRVGELLICGSKVGIYLVRDLHDGPTPCEGLYDPDTTDIYVDDALGGERAKWVLVHEGFHATLDLSGAMHELREDLKEGVDPGRVEERLVRTLTPHIVAMMAEREKKPRRAPGKVAKKPTPKKRGSK